MNELIDRVADAVAVIVMVIPLAAWLCDELFGDGGVFRPRRGGGIFRYADKDEAEEGHE